MNRYDTITIFDADTAEDERKEILAKVESLITSGIGDVLLFDHWGGRKLAYPIRKKNQGYYVRMDYCGNGDLVNAIERMLRHDLRVLRFMTVRSDINVDLEALKAELTEETEETTPESPAEKPAEAKTEATTETKSTETAEETVSEKSEEA